MPWAEKHFHFIAIKRLRDGWERLSISPPSSGGEKVIPE
jgi:hypothetical protein